MSRAEVRMYPVKTKLHLTSNRMNRRPMTRFASFRLGSACRFLHVKTLHSRIHVE